MAPVAAPSEVTALQGKWFLPPGAMPLGAQMGSSAVSPREQTREVLPQRGHGLRPQLGHRRDRRQLRGSMIGSEGARRCTLRSYRFAGKMVPASGGDAFGCADGLECCLPRQVLPQRAWLPARAAAQRAPRLSYWLRSRLDVLVEVEEVLGIVLRLDPSEALVVRPVRRTDPLLALLHHEVNVAAAALGGVRVERFPCRNGPVAHDGLVCPLGRDAEEDRGPARVAV